MSDADRHRLRATFAEDAELYERARPEYPAELFADLAALALLGPGSRVLEIGCGTGQATMALARLGCAVTAVELGGALAGIARRKLTGFEARVVVTTFEDWQLPPEPFDLVVAATSFHWVDPAVRVRKSADALRPGGSLAVISTHHVAGGTNRSSPTRSAATNCSTRPLPWACGFRPPTSCRATARNSISPAGSDRYCSAATTQTTPTPATGISICCPPSPDTGPCLRPPGRDCSAASGT
jgi:protein-L-isoaspartate O-methyltransferase